MVLDHVREVGGSAKRFLRLRRGGTKGGLCNEVFVEDGVDVAANKQCVTWGGCGDDVFEVVYGSGSPCWCCLMALEVGNVDVDECNGRFL